jgi:hypothetical protein
MTNFSNAYLDVKVRSIDRHTVVPPAYHLGRAAASADRETCSCSSNGMNGTLDVSVVDGSSASPAARLLLVYLERAQGRWSDPAHLEPCRPASSLVLQGVTRVTAVRSYTDILTSYTFRK